MGYRIKTTDITSSAAMPIKSGTLDLINSEFDNISRELGRGLIGRNLNTEAWVIWGCYPTIAGSSYSFTAGCVLYQGQLYPVDAASFSISGGQVPIFQIAPTNVIATNADPVLFSDSNTYNVHFYNKVQIVAGTSGAGIANFSAVKYYNTEWQAISGARFSNAFVRIHNGMLEFRGYSYWSTSPEPFFGTALFTFPQIFNRATHTACRALGVSDPGVGGTGGTLTYRDYINVRLDTDFKVFDGSTNVYSSMNRFGTPAALFDLTGLNGIPAYW